MKKPIKKKQVRLVDLQKALRMFEKQDTEKKFIRNRLKASEAVVTAAERVIWAVKLCPGYAQRRELIAWIAGGNSSGETAAAQVKRHFDADDNLNREIDGLSYELNRYRYTR